MAGIGPKGTNIPLWKRPVTIITLALLLCSLIVIASSIFSPEGGYAPSADPHKTAIAAGKGAPGSALEVLNGLAVAPEDRSQDYRREYFGKSWVDTDGNGCNTRNDILNRDLHNTTHVPGTCKVATGLLNDPYTGRTLTFLRGDKTSAEVQLDHVIALSNAWKTGASRLSEWQRIELANDPLNLLAVDGHSNQSKSNKDAAAWLPPNQDFRCPYVARQVSVKAKYGLWVTEDEKSAMLRVLRGCPQEPALSFSSGA
ncbi:MAG: HNH endonuclease family protein [Actinomycetaceae bacterium]|nr:HNH endonuclease family protein [Actinomycetaceae bacterium]